MTKNKVLKNRIVGAGLSVVTLASAAAPAISAFANDQTPATINAVDGEASMGYAPTQGVNNEIPASGVITINGAKATQSIKNKKFEIFRLFNAENAKAKESINYTFNPKYEQALKNVVADALTRKQNKTVKPEQVSEYMALDYMYSLDEHQKEGSNTEHKLNSSYSAYRYFVEDLRDEIKKQGIKGDTVTVQSLAEGQNKIELTGLSFGYYLVDEITTGDDVSNGQPSKDAKTPDGHKAPTEGKHFASSLIMVDTVNDKAVMTLKSDYPEVTKKIQEDDAKVGKNNDGWNDMGDFEIGQTIPYSYDASIPNMNGYHGYYYAFRDSADKELTMKTEKDSFNIVITKGDKKFTVPAEKWKLSAHNNVTTEVAETVIPLADDETFKIEFDDLKAVVDEAFPEIIDAKTQEGDYSGMSMHIEYAGFINDLAQDKTGRPGFENDVKLEFSNDPDASGEPGRNDKPTRPPHEPPHGETPKDTVVAFTYKLNGVKTNQDGYKLGDAEFRLYEDEEGTKEIKVKAVKEAKSDADTTAGATTPAGTVDNATAAPVADPATQPTDQPAGTTDAQPTTDAPTIGDGDLPKDDTAKTPTINETEKPGHIEEVLTEGKTTNRLNTNATRSENNRYVVVSNNGKNNDSDQAGAVIKSDSDGNFVITGLDSGTYWLREVKAPEGYRRLEKPIKLEVTSTFVEDRDHYVKGDGATENALKALAANGLITEFYDGIFKKDEAPLKTDVESGTINANVVNRKMPKLPLTGQQLSIVAYAGAAVAAGVAVVMTVKSKRKSDSEA